MSAQSDLLSKMQKGYLSNLFWIDSKNGESGTCEEDVTEEDIWVVAAHRVDQVYDFDGHDGREGLAKDEGAAGPGEHLYLTWNIDYY